MKGLHFRLARAEDLEWLSGQDRSLPRELHERKIRAGEVFLAVTGGQAQGCLQLEFIWSLVPYIRVIFVQEEYRRRGVGRGLLRFAEQHLREQGYRQLLSSSQVNEPAPQAWHRAVGFRECGVLNGINSGGVGEIFFRKELGRARAGRSALRPASKPG
jgi:GNAT superfamily N-acetyltransferase